VRWLRHAISSCVFEPLDSGRGRLSRPSDVSSSGRPPSRRCVRPGCCTRGRPRQAVARLGVSRLGGRRLPFAQPLAADWDRPTADVSHHGRLDAGALARASARFAAVALRPSLRPRFCFHRPMSAGSAESPPRGLWDLRRLAFIISDSTTSSTALYKRFYTTHRHDLARFRIGMPGFHRSSPTCPQINAARSRARFSAPARHRPPARLRIECDAKSLCCRPRKVRHPQLMQASTANR